MIRWIRQFKWEIGGTAAILLCSLGIVLLINTGMGPHRDQYWARYTCWNCGGSVDRGGMFSSTTVVPRGCWVNDGELLTNCCNCGVDLKSTK